MLKGPRNRIAGGIGADQFLDAVLCLAKLPVTPFQERYALLIPRERLFKPGPAVFKIAHNALQLGKRLFKGLWFVGVTHGPVHSWSPSRGASPPPFLPPPPPPPPPP